MRQERNLPTGERGAAFVLVTILTIVSIGLIGAYFTTSMQKMHHIRQLEAEIHAYNAAESGLHMAAGSVWAVYSNLKPAERVEGVKAFLGYSEEEVGEEPEIDADGLNESCGTGILAERAGLTEFLPAREHASSTCQVFVRDLRWKGAAYIDVEFVAVGSNDRSRRTLVSVVRYGVKTSQVFDNAYFINNFGWLWGAGITINGSVRSNGNFSLKDATVNGNIYASENEDLGAPGEVTGKSKVKDLKWYEEHASDRARPMNPSAVPEDLNGNGILDPGEDRNENGELDTFEYEDGYDGTSSRLDKLPVVKMPYLGDLVQQRTIATEEGGTVSQGGKVVIDGVLGDDEGEKENLVLIGTEEDPIVVNGLVVVENDLVIRGYVTGRGTIYTGRNVHIVGDVIYKDPPSWPKPMEDAAAVWTDNSKKDLVGFAAKGSVILGNYTEGGWKSKVGKYQRPPFTQSYVVDPTDDENGYVSYFDSEGRPVFDGDYTDYDGGMKADIIEKGPLKGEETLVSRRYYESSFSDEFIDELSENIRRLDGVFYTNHLLSGKVEDTVVNGTIVSRDEAILYSGHFFVNYDVRVRYSHYEFLEAFLPTEPMRKTLMFREGL